MSNQRQPKLMDELFPVGVVVRGLPAGTDPNLVKAEFSRFGPIHEVAVQTAVCFSGSHLLYITFENEGDARCAVAEMNNKEILGIKNVRVHKQQLERLTKLTCGRDRDLLDSMMGRRKRLAKPAKDQN